MDKYSLPVSATEIISHEPATGTELWRGAVGDVDETIDRARGAWPQWPNTPSAKYADSSAGPIPGV